MESLQTAEKAEGSYQVSWPYIMWTEVDGMSSGGTESSLKLTKGLPEARKVEGSSPGRMES